MLDFFTAWKHHTYGRLYPSGSDAYDAGEVNFAAPLGTAPIAELGTHTVEEGTGTCPENDASTGEIENTDSSGDAFPSFDDTEWSTVWQNGLDMASNPITGFARAPTFALLR